MNFTFGAARGLYAKKIHPRVLMGPEDLRQLRAAIHSGTAKRLFAALRRKTDPLRDRVLSAAELPEMLSQWNAKWDNPGTTVVWGLHDMALVAAITGEADMIEAVRRVLAALPAADKLLGRTGKNIGYGMEPYVPLAYDLLHDLMPETDREVFSRWALDFFVRFTMEKPRRFLFNSAGANIPMGEMLTGFAGLLAIDGDPGVPDLSAEKGIYVRMLEASLHAGIGPEGYPEEDGGYGYAMVGWLAYDAEAARRAGLLDHYREKAHYSRFGRAMLHFVQPWGEYLSNTGDHGDDIGERVFILARLAQENRDPVLVWLLETLFYGHASRRDLEEGFRAELPLGKDFQIPVTGFSLLMLDGLKRRPHPAQVRPAIPTAFKDSARGIVSFRSGWDPDASFVVFDGSQRSPAGQGHFHDSCGHFSLTALGEYFAIDTGRYNNEQNCHNVVLVDGRSGHPKNGEWEMSYYHGVLTDYRPDTFCDSAAVDSSHQHDCMWARRTLGFVKGAGAPSYIWMLDDINKANDWAEFWWQLQTSPENTIDLGDTSATLTGWRKGNHLDVHFALPGADWYPRPHVLKLEQDIATPSAHRYIGDLINTVPAQFQRPSDMLHHCVWRRPRLLAKVAGYNGRFLSLCLPRRKGDRPAVVTRLPADIGTLAFRIEFGAVTDTLVTAFDHRLLEAGDISGRGKWCVVRRSAKTGKVLDCALGHGTYLRCAGKFILK